MIKKSKYLYKRMTILFLTQFKGAKNDKKREKVKKGGCILDAKPKEERTCIKKA